MFQAYIYRCVCIYSFHYVKLTHTYFRYMTYFRYISDISQAYLRHVTDISQVYLRHILVISQLYLCHNTDFNHNIFWTYRRDISGAHLIGYLKILYIPSIYLFYVSDIFYIYIRNIIKRVGQTYLKYCISSKP